MFPSCTQLNQGCYTPINVKVHVCSKLFPVFLALNNIYSTSTSSNTLQATITVTSFHFQDHQLKIYYKSKKKSWKYPTTVLVHPLIFEFLKCSMLPIWKNENPNSLFSPCPLATL